MCTVERLASILVVTAHAMYLQHPGIDNVIRQVKGEKMQSIKTVNKAIYEDGETGRWRSPTLEEEHTESFMSIRDLLEKFSPNKRGLQGNWTSAPLLYYGHFREKAVLRPPHGEGSTDQ
ncbi:hypothetical protein EYF80_002987 [Liparis tanakae]|uniref:Uncharacterized protein n=1 Tax=Liparis tanakae TaxID=230148 RepID=A0A4Z2JAG8_9TELE|nr:hypothetical protein EYF80_002987 [Liparis tanakae]